MCGVMFVVYVVCGVYMHMVCVCMVYIWYKWYAFGVYIIMCVWIQYMVWYTMMCRES